MSTTTTFALFGGLADPYWNRGFRVLPIESNEKRPAKEINGWQGYAAGQLASGKRDDWKMRYADRGIGLLTGTDIGGGYKLGAIDIDVDLFVNVTQVVLGSSRVAKRGKKGLTEFVRYNDDLKSTKIMDFEKAGVIDVLLSGKFTVLPPSIHPDLGLPYTWLDTPLLDADLAELPDFTRRKLDLLKRVIGSEHVLTIVAGVSTHDAGLAFAAQLVQFGCEDEEILDLFTALLPVGYDGNSLNELPGWIESAREKGFDKKPGRRGQAGEKALAACDLLAVSLVEAGIELFTDNGERAFMSVLLPSGGRRTYLLGSRIANWYLQHAYYLLTKRAIKETALTEVVQLLEARARFEGAVEVVHTRVARDGDAVVIDLGTEDGCVVRITANGYDVLKASPVRFVMTSGMMALPEPQPGGDLRLLQQLLGLSEVTFTLTLAFIINALRPGGPYLYMLIEGEQGSGKSVLSAILRRLIDPHESEKLRLPENERDLMALAHAFYLLVFDNSSGMSADISDTLCTLATGGGFASRKLYTDGDLYFMKATRPFIINGISDVATKSDLIERLITVELTRPEEGERKTEEEILSEFNDIYPQILGALYDAVACALRNEGTIKTPRNVRMADAAKFLCAAEPSTGLPKGAFLTALERSQTDRIVERTDNDPVVVGLRSKLEKNPFEGTMGDLLSAIMPERPPRYFPDTPNKLSKTLDRLKNGMNKAGIYFERIGRTSKGQMIRVYLEGQENDKATGLHPPGTPDY